MDSRPAVDAESWQAPDRTDPASRTCSRHRRRRQPGTPRRSSHAATETGVQSHSGKRPKSDCPKTGDFATRNAGRPDAPRPPSAADLSDFPPLGSGPQTPRKAPMKESDAGPPPAGWVPRSPVADRGSATDGSAPVSPSSTEETRASSDDSAREIRSESSAPTDISTEDVKTVASNVFSGVRPDPRSPILGQTSEALSSEQGDHPGHSLRSENAQDSGVFGMAGLLHVLKGQDENLRLLSLGTDLESLGVNLDSPDPLYQTALPCDTYWDKPEDLPDRIHRLSEAQSKLSRFNDDTLFYIFYNMRGVLQELSARELFNRDWCWHKEFRFWLTRTPGTRPTSKTNNSESGSFTVFDPGKWQMVQWKGWIMYESLDARPKTPHLVNCTHAATAKAANPTESQAAVLPGATLASGYDAGPRVLYDSGAAERRGLQQIMPSHQISSEAHAATGPIQSHVLTWSLQEHQHQKPLEPYSYGGGAGPAADPSLEKGLSALQPIPARLAAQEAQREVKLQQLQQRWQWLHDQSHH